MWTCPICKTTNDTYICTSCGFDASRDYTHHRFLCQLSESASKIPKPVQPGENILMTNGDEKTIFGKELDRSKVRTVYFLNSKRNIGEDAWDVSEGQNGRVLAWTKEEEGGLLGLYIAANGNIIANRDSSNLFWLYENLENIFGLEFLQTCQTEDMNGMFCGCKSLKTLDLGCFNTRCVKDMDYMFSECTSLERLDVSGFDTSRAEGMVQMFFYCRNLKAVDLTRFDTSQVEDMCFMFEGCEKLEKLDLSRFDTSQVKNMIDIFKDCSSLTELDISNFDIRQIKEDYFSFEEYTGLSKLPHVKVKQSVKLWPSTIMELAKLGESYYQLEEAKMDIRSSKRIGIPLSERESQWLQKTAASGEKEAQLQLSVYYNNRSIHVRCGEVHYETLDGLAFFWQKRAWTRYLTPRNVSYPHEFDYVYPEDSLTADQEYIIALDYDLKIRSEAQKMHSKAADRLNEEEFLKLKGIVERNRESWLRKAAEHGSKEAQYYLGILLYSVSQEEGLDWLDKSQAQGYEPAKTVLSRRAEQEKNISKAGFLEKMFHKKSSEKNILPLEIDPVKKPEFLGLCRLAEEGDLEAKLFLAKEYEKEGLWDQAFPLYTPVAWSGNPFVMEIVAGCYAEGKGTEKNLAEASFWYERALRRGKPTMEDPAKNLDEQEKRELLSSKQKHILRLDAEAGAYEKQKSKEGDEDVEVSKL